MKKNKRLFQIIFLEILHDLGYFIICRNLYKSITTFAWVAELVDARDLKSLGAQSLYEFKSRPGHQKQRVWQGRGLLSPFLLGVNSNHKCNIFGDEGLS